MITNIIVPVKSFYLAIQILGIYLSHTLTQRCMCKSVHCNFACNTKTCKKNAVSDVKRKLDNLLWYTYPGCESYAAIKRLGPTARA